MVHSWSKASRVAVIQQVTGADGQLTSSPAAILQDTVKVWSSIWKASVSVPAGPGILTAAGPEIPPLSVDDFCFRTKAFRSKTAVASISLWQNASPCGGAGGQAA
jgi:hypothetical protein